MSVLKKSGYIICVAVSLYCLFFAFAPLPFGVFNAGMVGLGVFGAALLLLLFLWDAFDGWGRIPRRLREVSDHRRDPPPRWWKHIRFLWALALALCALGASSLSFFMAKAAWYNPPEPGATVIVLGCQVLDDQPSLMLARRLEAALSFLQESPNSAVVCSGGRGNKADSTSEASVMAAYLTNHGVDPSRIYLEENSANTLQNITYSFKIIQENGLPQSVAIATDGFHQYRGQLYARKAGLFASGLPAETPWGLFPSYWVREWFGIAKAAVLD